MPSLKLTVTLVTGRPLGSLNVSPQSTVRAAPSCCTFRAENARRF
jgi:hypothetical protein